MELPSKKVFLTESFILDITEHLDDDWELVMNRMMVLFLSCDYVTMEEAKRIEADCKALMGKGITQTDEGVSYT